MKYKYILWILFILLIPIQANAEDYVDEITELIQKYPIIDTDNYDVSNNDMSTYSKQFETRRLFIMGSQPSYTYNAIDEVTKPGFYTIYQYDSPEAAEKAYKSFKVKGYDVYIDEVIEEFSLVNNETHLDSGIELMGLDKMQKNPYFLKNKVSVALIDSGVRPEYRDSSRIIYERDFTDDSAGANNRIHGSRVAGIIADSCPENISIISLKVINSEGKSSMSVIDAALTYAYENNADVINMSIGADVNSSTKNITILNKSIDTAILHNIPVIVSAGNSGHSTDYCYPASYSPVWAVSSVNKNKAFSSFSNFGEIDFCAPGEPIQTIDGETDSGTSFSTPYITAFAATLKGGMSFVSVEDEYCYMQSICEDLGDPGYDKHYGNGLPKYIETYNCDISGHIWQEAEITPATCTDSEIHTYICEKCGNTKQDNTGSPLGHDYVISDNIAATCTKQGSITKKCVRCGNIISSTIPVNQNNHIHTKLVKTSPTCIAPGSTDKICDDCGITIEHISIALIPHDYLAVRKEPTSNENGYIKRTCSICGDTKYIILPMITQESIVPTNNTTENDIQKEQYSTESTNNNETKSITSQKSSFPPDIKIKKIRKLKGKRLLITSNKKNYQIQISSSKKMKKSKKYISYSTRYIIKGLKKKTYYLRIRSIENGSYGKWSKYKKIKIRK